jgi:hypothetical protein
MNWADIYWFLIIRIWFLMVLRHREGFIFHLSESSSRVCVSVIHTYDPILSLDTNPFNWYTKTWNFRKECEACNKELKRKLVVVEQKCEAVETVAMLQGTATHPAPCLMLEWAQDAWRIYHTLYPFFFNLPVAKTTDYVFRRGFLLRQLHNINDSYRSFTLFGILKFICFS